MIEWTAHFEDYRVLAAQEAEIRAKRAGLESLNRCIAGQREVIRRAASTLPSGGDAVSWINRALSDATVDSPEHRFALELLGHRRMFPRVYLAALVRAATRHGMRVWCSPGLR